MIIIFNSISPAEAARESQALDAASKRILASPELRREFLRKLGFKVSEDKTLPPERKKDARRRK